MRSNVVPVLAFFILAGALAAAPDFVGAWIGKTEIPEAGIDELTLVIQKKEAAYFGAISDTLGYLAPGTELKEIKVDGDVMAFQFYLVDGSLMSGKLTLKDETMTGTWIHPEGNSAEMKFERKK